MLGHATADIVSRSIIDSLKSDEVDITKMLMLGGDNPNVNKAIEDILYKKRFKSTVWFIDESINDIWCWFSRSSARQGDFITAATSINETYSRFLSRELVWLQQEEPFAHLLYGEFCNLLRNIMLPFVKEELLKDKEGSDLLSVSFEHQNSQKNNANIDIGETTRTYIKDLSASEKAIFFQNIRQVYCTITKELTKSLPLKNDFLRHLQCLQPLARQQESSRTSIMYLSRHVPYLLTNEEIDRVGAEWRVYQMADIPEEWFRKTTVYSDHIIEYLPIDKYWYRIFSTATSTGTPQYVVLTKLVKCLLSLSHGNSDVERGFSENNHLVPDDRSSLNEASINGLRATKAAVKFFRGGKAHAVPTTSTLISNVKEAYSRYTKDNEQQQKLIKSTDVANGKRGPEVEHERLEEKETQLINEQKNLQEELTKVTNMLEEGTTRLAAAMKNKKFDDIGTTEVLVTAANAKLAVLKTKLIENDENLNRLRKKIN
ncbi:unnamed protein product [Rotaria socialis]|uniref:Uncharacterized protein n=1 Tax=Rotaria socialis TaxID=392032 RepID=A0A821CDS7_9BILA|nr:unnamed protein product [Rotaria socialis]